ncbi:MAG: hypothetical protein JWN23_153 [Rhodocyclales bacterium]|nr:hypothetical protein [Rhodocyclales bacterium]
MQTLSNVASKVFDRLFLSQLALCDEDFQIAKVPPAAVPPYRPTEDEIEKSGPLAYSYFGA